MTARNYLTDNSRTSVVQTQCGRLNNFPLNGTDQTVSEITITDVAGNQAKSTTTIDRAAKKQIITIDTPDSNLNVVNIPGDAIHTIESCDNAFEGPRTADLGIRTLNDYANSLNGIRCRNVEASRDFTFTVTHRNFQTVINSTGTIVTIKPK